MRAKIKKSNTTEPYSFTVVDDEGKTLLISDNYKAKDSAFKGIRAFKKNCINDKRYILKVSSNGMFFYNLTSGNGQVVATSALYSTDEERSKAISVVKRLAPDCLVDEIA